MPLAGSQKMAFHDMLDEQFHCSDPVKHCKRVMWSAQCEAGQTQSIDIVACLLHIYHRIRRTTVAPTTRQWQEQLTVQTSITISTSQYST